MATTTRIVFIKVLLPYFLFLILRLEIIYCWMFWFSRGTHLASVNFSLTWFLRRLIRRRGRRREEEVREKPGRLRTDRKSFSLQPTSDSSDSSLERRRNFAKSSSISGPENSGNSLSGREDSACRPDLEDRADCG